MTEKFNQKVAVVTGAARGIGKAISQKLLQDGLTVVGADISQTELEATADDVCGYLKSRIAGTG